MTAIGPIFSAMGLAVLAFRLGPAAWSGRHLKKRFEVSRDIPGKSDSRELVSIIIPARNEEKNLPALLRSLSQLDYREIEVIVVDDDSRDRTFAMAEEWASRDSRFNVIRGAAKPAGWVGKTWACLQGAKASRADWLLFTDADTEHSLRGLATAIQQAKDDQLDMLSAIPFHEVQTRFDPFVGPFHLLTLLASSAFSRPQPGRVFAIGQYLLFRKQAYFKIGTHEAVKMSFGEDLDLAQLCLESGDRYDVNRSGQIFSVRMYGSLTEFVEGWRRIFRVGLVHARPLASVEIFLVIACLTASFRFSRATTFEGVLSVGGLVILGFAQRRYGRFSWVGVLFAPLSLALFTSITALALLDRITGRDLRWRGRSYKIGP